MPKKMEKDERETKSHFGVANFEKRKHPSVVSLK
jgi:hypothetical protein